MNTKLLTILLLLVGFGLAVWLGWPRDGDLPVEDRMPAAQAPDQPDASPASTAAAGEVVSEADASVEAIDQPERTEIAAAGEEPVAGSSAKIRGRLIGVNDESLPDVELQYTKWRRDPEQDLGFSFLGKTGSKHELATAADGSFEFELAVDEIVRLSLSGDYLVFAEPPPFVQGRKGDQDLGELPVYRAGIVLGIVRDVRGDPVAGVSIEASRDGYRLGVPGNAVSGEDGSFLVGKLRPGSWTLRTASAQFLPMTHQVDIEHGDRIEGVVLTVVKGRAIAGRVIDDLGQPVAGIQVGAKRSELSPSGVEVGRFTAGEATTTADNGMFVLSGLEGEQVSIRAFGPDYSTALASGVDVGTSDLVLQVRRLAAIEGVLQAVDGTALAGSRVYARSADDKGGPMHLPFLTALGMSSVTTDENGAFRLEGVVPGEVTVSADGKLHRPASTSIHVAPGETKDGVLLTAQRGATARITVVDGDGRPVARAKVSARPPRSSDGSSNSVMMSVETISNVPMRSPGSPLGSAETDEQGVAVITGLNEGSVVFHAAHPDFAAARPLTLPLQPNGVVDLVMNMRVPGFVDLRVTTGAGAIAADAGYMIRSLDDDEARMSEGKTDDEGQALVGPLAAGAYFVELVHDDYAMTIGEGFLSLIVDSNESIAIAGSRQRFMVKAGETVVVEVKRPILTRVHGAVLGVDGPIADARVEINKETAPNAGLSMLGGGHGAKTASDGTFSIEGLEPGRYLIGYGRKGQAVKAEVALTIPSGVPELRQDLVLRTGTIRVQAWSQHDDRPIANASVELRKAMPSGGGEVMRATGMVMVSVDAGDSAAAESTTVTVGGKHAKTGADGWAEIEDVPVGDYDVKVTHERHVEAEKSGVSVIELQTSDAGRVVMTQAGNIRGKVVAADGSDAGMTLVFHRPIDGKEGQPAVAFGGAFRIDGLSVGRHVLRAQEIQISNHGGSGGLSKDSPTVEVEVRAGETTAVELTLPVK